MRVTPERLRPRTERAVARIDAVFKNYKWSRRIGYDRLRITDEATGRSTSNDPTQDVTLAQQVIRQLVQEGEQALLEATVAFEKADYCFEAALKKADNRSPRSRDSDFRGSWVSPKERRKLKQAQGRREERGEDVP